MIICPACQHENVDGTQFCEMCGEELPSAASVAATENLIKCPQCGFENPSDNLACEACGAVLQPGAAAPVSLQKPSDDDVFGADDSGLAPPLGASATPAVAPATPAAPIAATPAPTTPGDLAPGRVKLVVEQGQTVGAQFVLGDAEMLVGREDEDEAIYPDIDLSDQDAGYVHRKHATLTFDNGHLSVTHLGGSNKTRVNNKPVPDNVPSPLKLGDKIAFGKVVLRLLPA